MPPKDLAYQLSASSTPAPPASLAPLPVRKPPKANAATRAKQIATTTRSTANRAKVKKLAKKKSKNFQKSPDPVISKNDLVSVLRCLLSDKLTECEGGALTAQFETEFARKLRQRNALFVINDSAAIYLILQTLKLPRGSTALLSPLVEPQVYEALRHAGINVTFMDLVPGQLFCDKKRLYAQLSSKVAILILSHSCGMPQEDAPEIIAYTKQHFPNICIIEEAFSALGATCNYKDKKKHVGTWGDYGLFSLAAQRTFTSAKGAIIIAQDATQLEKLRYYRSPVLAGIYPEMYFSKIASYHKIAIKDKKPKQGKTASPAAPPQDAANAGKDLAAEKSSTPILAYATYARLDFVPTELEAALGLSQLDQHNKFFSRCQTLYTTLAQALAKNTTVTVLQPRKGSSNYRFLLLYLPKGRINAYERFKRSGFTKILLDPHTLYGALSREPQLMALPPATLKIVKELHHKTLAIPIHAGLSDQEISTLSAILKAL